MKKPLIGVTINYDESTFIYSVNQTYVKSVSKAGGIPVLISYTNEDDVDALAKRLDGFVFTGGPDMDPAFFGEEPVPGIGSINPTRDNFEMKLVAAVMKTGKPILAICRGCQLLNVACGGTLIQDIYSQYKADNLIKHVQAAPRWHASHSVNLMPNTKFAEVFPGKTTIKVNSFHHQAIKELAPGWIIAAQAPDGIIEAAEATNYPFLLAAQWHPECFFEFTDFDLLFKKFVKACK